MAFGIHVHKMAASIEAFVHFQSCVLSPSSESVNFWPDSCRFEQMEPVLVRAAAEHELGPTWYFRVLIEFVFSKEKKKIKVEKCNWKARNIISGQYFL